MAIQTQGMHHITLTVTNVERSRAFYSNVLGLQFVTAITPERLIFTDGKTLVVISTPPDPDQILPQDRFNENRIGLDHASFSVGSYEELVDAVAVFDRNNVSHGDIKDLGAGFGIYVLAFRDPDNIQLELTAPYAR